MCNSVVRGSTMLDGFEMRSSGYCVYCGCTRGAIVPYEDICYVGTSSSLSQRCSHSTAVARGYRRDSHKQSFRSTQPRRLPLIIPYLDLLPLLCALIPQHPTINPHIIALHLQPRLRFLGLDHEMVVAVRAVLVAILKLLHVLPEALLALFAREGHVHGLFELVRLRVGVALRAIEPLPAAGRADGDLGVEDVFAV